MLAGIVRVAELGYGRFFNAATTTTTQPRQHEIEAETGIEAEAAAAAAVAIACCGATASLLALADGGRVYGWGTELAGELLGATTTTTAFNDNDATIPSTAALLLPLPPPLSGARRVTALACGPHHVLLAAAGGGVWAWGLDVNGQTLGLGACGRRLCLVCGGKEDGEAAAAAAAVVLAPRQVAGLEKAEVGALAAGEGHALAVAAGGRGVWAWGCGSSGQLGVGRKRRRRLREGELEGNGEEEVVVEDGEVCSCRPLPLDIAALDSPSPSSPTTTTTIIITHAAVGKRHSLLLTHEGHVYSFGSGLYHALGHGRTEGEWAPRLVAALEGIGEMRPDGRFVGGMAAVACGAWHSLALSRSGDVYGWGWNRQGQLGGVTVGGGGGAATLVPVPRLLRVGVGEEEEEEEEEDVEFAQIGAGVHYSAGLAQNGRVYVWGTLGLAHDDNDAASSPSPTAVQQERQRASWDVAGPLQLQQQQQQVAGASVGLACGPYHLAVFAKGGSMKRG